MDSKLLLALTRRTNTKFVPTGLQGGDRKHIKVFVTHIPTSIVHHISNRLVRLAPCFVGVHHISMPVNEALCGKLKGILTDVE